MKYRVKHFEAKEFACPCCGVIQVSSYLVFLLDMIRNGVNLPLKINSGFRCLSHNKEVNGSEMSRHMIGCAVDVALPKGMKYAAFVSLMKRYSVDGFEICTYPSESYLHFGVPRSEFKKLWSGGELTL